MSGKLITFEHDDYIIRGYLLDVTQRLHVDVVLLKNGFFPKLSHSNNTIENNVIRRSVEIPSLLDLQKQGYGVDKAVFIAEISVHPKHIKNWNFWRIFFPSILRKTAQKTNIALIVPTLDVPTARITRKEFASAIRMAGIPPLYKGGKRYTTGYLSCFIVPPSDEAMITFKKKMGIK